MLTHVIRALCPCGTVDAERRAQAGRPSTLLALVIVALGASSVTPSACQARRAPILRAHGTALEWTRAGRRNRYKLSISAPDQRGTVMVIGRRFTPPAHPGVRVTYRVKAAFNESAWSNVASITYPVGPQEQKRRREGPSGQAQGRVKYRLDAASYFDRFAQPQFASWARARISLIKGYPPFGDVYVSLFGLPVIGYHDPATGGQAPLARGGIEDYVGKVRRDMRHGYAGVFIDDANWSAGFTPSPGPRASLANLIEAIRAAAPDALIEINSHYPDIWPLMRSGDPDVARALREVNTVFMEFGVGPTSGIDSGQDYGEFMQYADALHAKGIALTLAGDRRSNDVPTMEYNLATYFLVNNRGDYVNGIGQAPGGWWSGFDVNLGTALGPRERLPDGVWTRRFSAGVVYAVEPKAGTQTIGLGRTMHSAEWGDVRSLTLAAGQGAVLLG
jgi:hypothetical protein